MNWQRTIGLLLLGLGMAVATLKYSAGQDLGPKVTQLVARANPKWGESLKKPQPAQYVTWGLMGVPGVLGLAFLIWGISKDKKAAPKNTTTAKTRKQAGAPVHSCNILRLGPATQQLWQFEAKSGNLAFRHEYQATADERLPEHAIAKDWHHLFQRKLNVAWLPPEQVFLRVIHLPASDLDETLSMVEFQMEKLSPMPVAQVVWSIQVLARAEEGLQTILVLIVARSVVEEYLGQLETRGYMADRLELPFVDELQNTPAAADGAWVYPVGGASNSALVAWRYDGTLRSVGLVTMSPEDSAGLREQLMQMAWAGELEGWLTKTPSWHLVADEASQAVWEPILKAGLELPIDVIPAQAAKTLAEHTAQRATTAEPRINLLPAEFQERYQQQFVDRLWMRGLGAVVGLYIVGVLIYFVALGVASYRTRQVESTVALMAPQYTNAMQLKARYEVLKDRQELKYAALDCWSVTARLLPEGVTLETMSFVDGKKLRLDGTAPSDQVQKLIDFEGYMRKATDATGQPLFDATKGDNLNYRAAPGNANVSWNVTLELKRVEVQ